MITLFFTYDYPRWSIYSPITKTWARANQVMAQSILLMMNMQPALYEGWKVAYEEDPVLAEKLSKAEKNE